MKRYLPLLFIATASIYAGCSKEEVRPTPIPPTETPKPTITVTATPSSTVEYGDSVTVSYTSTNANGASGSTKLRPFNDTTITRSVTGPGGTASGSINLDVLDPDQKTLLLTMNFWKVQSKKIKNTDGTWSNIILNSCEISDSSYFYLTFKAYYTHHCIDSVPAGYGYSNWKWKSGDTSNRDSLDWGSSIYAVKELTANKLVLYQKVPVIPGPGTKDVESVYYR
jgi:hypothetical protein